MITSKLVMQALSRDLVPNIGTWPLPLLSSQRALPNKLNRLSVSFLVAPNHTDHYPLQNKSSDAPSKSSPTMNDGGEDALLHTSPKREVTPTNMHDVAQILSTLKDHIVPASSPPAKTWPTSLGKPQKQDLYRSTVLGARLSKRSSHSHNTSSSVVVFAPSLHAKEGRISKAHRCVDCGGTFKQRGALVSHIRGVHKQERPYLCDYEDCTAAYKYRGDLNRHRDSVHCGFKPFPCLECGIPFARKSVRDRHARKKHKKDNRALGDRS